MALAWPFKDPDEVLDYDVNWSPRLQGDTILTSSWTVVGGDGALVAGSNSIEGGITAKLWLSGGTSGKNYLLNNRVVTTGGRTMDQTISIKVKPR